MMNHGLLLTWANNDVYPPKEFIGREIVSDIWANIWFSIGHLIQRIYLYQS